MNRTLLVVEDNDVNRELMREFLELLGYQVECAQDGAEALELVRRVEPAMILTDIRMPRLDGYGLLTALRRDPATKALPVIALTASAMNDEMAHARSAGFEEVLPKPVDFAALVTVIRKRTGGPME